MINEITIRFSGEQGSGVQYTGQLAASYFTRIGCHVFAVNNFESRIIGGYSFRSNAGRYRIQVCRRA